MSTSTAAIGPALRLLWSSRASFRTRDQVPRLLRDQGRRFKSVQLWFWARWRLLADRIVSGSSVWTKGFRGIVRDGGGGPAQRQPRPDRKRTLHRRQVPTNQLLTSQAWLSWHYLQRVKSGQLDSAVQATFYSRKPWKRTRVVVVIWTILSSGHKITCGVGLEFSSPGLHSVFTGCESLTERQQSLGRARIMA